MTSLSHSTSKLIGLTDCASLVMMLVSDSSDTYSYGNSFDIDYRVPSICGFGVTTQSGLLLPDSRSKELVVELVFT